MLLYNVGLTINEIRAFEALTKLYDLQLLTEAENKCIESMRLALWTEYYKVKGEPLGEPLHGLPGQVRKG